MPFVRSFLITAGHFIKTQEQPLITYINELLLLLLCQLSEAVVSSSQVSLQPSQSIHHHPFHFSALCPGAGRGQAQAPDATASPHPGRQHVALIKITRMNLKRKYLGEQLNFKSILTEFLPMVSMLTFPGTG